MSPRRNFINNCDEKQADLEAYDAQNMQLNQYGQQFQQIPNQQPVYYFPVIPQRVIHPFVGVQQGLNFLPAAALDPISSPRRSVADFNSCNIAKRQEEKIKRLEQKCEEMKRELEDDSKFSIKRVSIASDSEADELPPLASKNGKKKKTSHRRSSHKKGHKKSKRRRGSRSSSSSNKSSDNSSYVEILNDDSRDIKIRSIFDVENNPWKLLRRSEYIYKTTHLVVEIKGDSKNLTSDRSPKKDVAKHDSLNGALSTIFGAICFTDSAVPLKNERYYDILNTNSGKEVERFFCHKEPVGIIDVQPVPISTTRCTFKNDNDDLIANQAAVMDLNAYDDYQKSKFLSWEEAGLEEKRILLSTRKNLDPNDVDAWIKLIRLQNQLIAFEESGTVEADVSNKRALYRAKDYILCKALRSNRSNIALHLEKLNVMEAYFGPMSVEVSEIERSLVREFPYCIEMWESFIHRKQSNQTTFEKNKIINMIDVCLKNMVGARKSNIIDDATADRFLVSLLLHRCKLLIECGFADQAVASLQAITEFHFFSPKDRAPLDDQLTNNFKYFWVKGVPRIGDEGATGWDRFQMNEPTLTNESAALKKELRSIRKKEELIFETCCKKMYSTAEIWRQLESFRDQACWRPVRGADVPIELFKFSWRKVSFDELQPVLFTLSNIKFAEDLVYKILQLFGAVVPGIHGNFQEDTLGRFDADIFPSFSTHYTGMAEFLDRFLLLLSTAKDADHLRILLSRELTYVRYELSNEDMDTDAQEKALKLRLKSVENSTNTGKMTKIAMSFYLLKSFKKVTDISCSSKLIVFLSALFSDPELCVWTISREEDRLVYLRMAKTLCRRLPSSDEVAVSNSQSLTKLTFLIRFGINGNLKEVPNSSDHRDKARSGWLRCLKNYSNSMPAKLNWLGNEAEIILELAATFFVEITEGGRLKKWKTFDKAMTESPLSKSLRSRPIVQKLRCKFYNIEIARSSSFSLKVLIHMLQTAMEEFPECVYFAKNFVKLSKSFQAVLYLKKNPGKSWLQRQIRSSALVLLRLKEFDKGFLNLTSFVQQVTAIAANDDYMMVPPDAYLWIWLLSHDAVKNSAKKIEQIYQLALKHCPWSKHFLLEITRITGPFSDLPQGLTEIFESNGLQLYWHPDEVSRQMAL